MAEASWLKEKAASKPSEWTHAKTAPLRSKTSSHGKSSKSSDDPASRKLREMNKRLRTILEDGGVEYGEEDVDEVEIMDRFTVALKIRKNSISSVMKEIKRSRNVDLCFLVDATGSMQPHIDGVRTSIAKIVDCLMNTSKHVTFATQSGTVSSLRLAFVAYRDHRDAKQFEILNFVESTATFRSFCECIRAEGGGDTPEDVFGGLEKMLQLGWSPNSGTRVVFHIADAPCHGRLFTYGLDDDYPEGDPKGRTHTALFALLREKGIQYYFGKINNYTDKMIQEFSRVYGEQITDFDVKDVEKIRDSVITAVSESVSASISASKASGGVKHKVRPFTIETAIPDWSREAKVEGRFITYEHPASIKDIIDDNPLVRKESKKALVQIAKNPFAQGSERIAYYGRDVTHVRRETPPSSERTPPPSSKATEIDIVLKEYKFVGKGTNTAARYEITNQLQTIASYLAIGFTNELKRKSPDMHMETKFLKIKTLATETMRGKIRFMSCERCFTGGEDFLRFSNNTDYGMLESKAKEKGVDIKYVQLLMAFSHWTYQVTKTELMVVDLQGIITKSKKGAQKVLLTDPAIHSKDPTRYGQMNHGEEGMANFFSRHECNDFCRLLSLKMPTKFSSVPVSSSATSSRRT